MAKIVQILYGILVQGTSISPVILGTEAIQQVLDHDRIWLINRQRSCRSSPSSQSGYN